MHLFKAKVFKLALQSTALAFFVFIFVGVSQVEAAKPAITAQDTCGFSAVKVATVNLSSNNTCNVTGLTGFAGGDLNITGANTIVDIAAGAKIVLDPGRSINMNPPKGQIIIHTAGMTDAIVHGSLCILDNDQDGYANNGASYVYLAPNASNVKQACTVLGALYVEKTAVSTTEYDCYPDDPSKQDCCTNGYKDVDKDGDGAGAYGCYVADASYNVSANNYDCNDNSASVKNGTVTGTFCGIGGCGSSGSDTCTNGTTVHTTPCVTSAKSCCDAGGNYVVAQTPISTCLKCNGAAADPVNQTAAEDLGNKCATGGCQLDTCSGLGDYCGYTPSGTACRGAAGTCDLAETCTGSSYTCPTDAYKNNANICSTGGFDNPAIGSCQRTATDQYCSGTATACSGSTANRYEYAGTDGNIWNGAGAWVAANSGNYKSLTSPYTCSGYTTILGSYYGCAAAANTVGSTAKGTKATVVCSGAESDMCISGLSTCTNACAAPYYPTDNNGNGYTDVLDPACGAQCSSGACCDTSTGLFRNSSYTCNASAGTCDVAENCTGVSNACPTDAFQPSSYVCSTATGSAGSCQISGLKCTGTSNSCSVAYTVNASTNNYVWNGSSWAAASTSNTCSAVASTCTGYTQINNNYYGCAVGSNTCNGTAAGAATVACTGTENNMCITGNSSCINACVQVNPSYPGDNNANGYTDAQDAACGGCGQCTSGAYCNTSTGCIYPDNTVICRASVSNCDPAEYYSGSTCPANSFAAVGTTCYTNSGCSGGILAGNGCTYSYYDLQCNGSTADCNRSVNRGSCNCPVNTSWSGSSCGGTTCAANGYNGVGNYTCYSATNLGYYAQTCNGSGACNINYGSLQPTTACSTVNASYPYCIGNGSCVQCTAASQCGTNGFTTGANSCSGAQPQGTYRTYSCASNACSYFDSPANYGSACSSGVCSGGVCQCAAATVSGYPVSQLAYAASIGVAKAPCYRTAGGTWYATATCNSGTIGITGESLLCANGYTHVNGSWYQSTYGCYDVCVIAVCSIGTYSGYYVGAPMNHYTTGSYSKSATNGTWNATLFCADGSVSVQSEALSCNNGYYLSGSTCYSCTAGYYCTSNSQNQCPANTYSTGTASSCTNCPSTYTSPAGSTSSGACTAPATICGPGYYASGASCLACSNGSYKAGTNTLTYCTACPAGSYAVGSANTSCTACPSGYYCTGGSAITKCPDYTTSPSNSTSSGSCTACTLLCNPGYVVSTTCLSCGACSPAGYGKNGTNNLTTCSYCSAGTYNTDIGQPCYTCESGYYCTGGTNHTACTYPYTASPAGSSSSGQCYIPGT